jgi:cyanophycin synthetase
MEITRTHIIRGHNTWSENHHELFAATLSLAVFRQGEEKKLLEAAKKQIPGLPELSGVEDLAAELLKHLQKKAGWPEGFVTAVKDENNGIMLVFSFRDDAAAHFAAKAVSWIIKGIFRDEPEDIRELAKELAQTRSRIGPTAAYLLNEVKRRKIPFCHTEAGSLITIGHGSKQKKLRTAVADTTSGLGMELAGDKEETKDILQAAHLPVPKGIIVYSKEELSERFGEVRPPVVVKPLDGNHGRGVTTNIRTLEGALFGYEVAERISDTVIVEEFIPGDDYRFLVIDYQLVAVAKRVPAHVVGDGKSTIQQLIDTENKNPDRGKRAEHVLALIQVDKITERILADNKLTLDTVLKKGEMLKLKDTANISAGGTAEDVTDFVHPENKFMAEHIARMFKLNICGIDIVTTSVETPITRETGGIIEVNAGPGLRMHSDPQKGKSRNVAEAVVRMLFSDKASAEIPVIAYFGGKENARSICLTAEIAGNAKLRTGVSTSGKVFIQGHLISEGIEDDHSNGQDVLFDPLVDYAVLACSAESIHRSGLCFDSCMVALFSDKHLMGGKNESKIKAALALADSISNVGHIVLDADCDLLNEFLGRTSKIALYSRNMNRHISRHIEAGGMAALIEDDQVIICRDGLKIKLLKLEQLSPALSDCDPAELLPAILAALLSGLEYEAIIGTLREYQNKYMTV